MRLTCWRLSPLDGTSNGMVVDLAVLHLAQGLRARSDQLYVPTIQIEHIRAGVDLSKMSVCVEGVKRGRSAESLGRHCLDDVSLHDMLFELRYKAFITGLADV